jgi:phytoene dehydrogenase-like protein
VSAPIVIIGGGVAGLSCGCYLQMNGYQTQILEANKEPGGLCVSWDRGPYVFDGCLRWLAGTHPSSIFHKVWKELGVFADHKIVNYNEFMRIEGQDGQFVNLPSDLDKLGAEFKRIAPEDSARIDKLIRAARKCVALDPPPQPLELMSGFEKTKMLGPILPMLTVVFGWKNTSIADYVAQYRNPFLREVLLTLTGDPRMSSLVLVMILSIRGGPNAGCITGGSRGLSESVARRYTKLGGQIRYSTHASSVTVEQNRAVGVLSSTGENIPAGTVVSCADGHTAIFKMLQGRYVNRLLVRAYKNFDVFPGLIQASFGINKTFPATAPTLSIPLREPLVVDDVTKVERLEVSTYGSDSEFCPPGKTVILVRFATRYDYWVQLRTHQPAEYRKAKARLQEQLVAILDQRFPGAGSHVEHADLCTPASYERWTGNRQGSFQGWLPTPQLLGRKFPRTLPGLKNFYMAGHWVEPGGGLPPAALSGRYAAQMICARDGKQFATTIA